MIIGQANVSVPDSPQLVSNYQNIPKCIFREDRRASLLCILLTKTKYSWKNTEGSR